MKKKLFALTLLLALCLSMTVSVLAAEDTPPRVWDEANLLSASQEGELTDRLEEIGGEYSIYVSIVTLKDSHHYNLERFAEDMFFQYGYGYGENEDGILLVIEMSSQEWAIFANGICEEAISGTDIVDIGERMTEVLSDGNYYRAFEIFADECESYMYDHTHFQWLTWTVAALVVGLIVALIVTAVLRGQLKSVHYKANATDYVKPGSMHVNISRDIFLYRTISRRPRPKSNSGSSSGSSRGSSGSGRF